MTSHCGVNVHLLRVNDIEHLFMCLLAICALSSVKCMFRSFTLLFGGFNIYIYTFFFFFFFLLSRLIKVARSEVG